MFGTQSSFSWNSTVQLCGLDRRDFRTRLLPQYPGQARVSVLALAQSHTRRQLKCHHHQQNYLSELCCAGAGSPATLTANTIFMTRSAHKSSAEHCTLKKAPALVVGYLSSQKIPRHTQHLQMLTFQLQYL